MRRLILATIATGILITVLCAQNGPDPSGVPAAGPANSVHSSHKAGKGTRHHHRHHQHHHHKKQ